MADPESWSMGMPIYRTVALADERDCWLGVNG